MGKGIELMTPTTLRERPGSEMPKKKRVPRAMTGTLKKSFGKTRPSMVEKSEKLSVNNFVKRDLSGDGQSRHLSSIPTVKCPHCYRTFNQAASDRHIPICREKHQRYIKVLPTKHKPKQENQSTTPTRRAVNRLGAAKKSLQANPAALLKSGKALKRNQTEKVIPKVEATTKQA